MPSLTKIRNWPYGFLDAFWERTSWAEPDDVRAKEMEASVEYALRAGDLNARTEAMIRMRYQRRMTLKEIGDYYAVSRECVRSQIVHGIYQLRRKTVNREILDRGLTAYMRKRIVLSENARIEELVQERIMRVQMEDLRSRNGGRRFAQRQDSSSPARPVSANTPIEELDLSCRTYNCMKRGGYNTIAEILEIDSREALMQTRNFGVKSCHELLFTLEGMGFDISHLKPQEDRESSMGA